MFPSSAKRDNHKKSWSESYSLFDLTSWKLFTDQWWMEENIAPMLLQYHTAIIHTNPRLLNLKCYNIWHIFHVMNIQVQFKFYPEFIKTLDQTWTTYVLSNETHFIILQYWFSRLADNVISERLIHYRTLEEFQVICATVNYKQKH